MMIQSTSQGGLRPETDTMIEAAIAAHGARRVLVAAVLALLRGRLRKTRPPDVGVLDDRLRADAGLPPAGEVNPRDLAHHLVALGPDPLRHLQR